MFYSQNSGVFVDGGTKSILLDPNFNQACTTVLLVLLLSLLLLCVAYNSYGGTWSSFPR